MQGGKKGLLVNSTDLCKAKPAGDGSVQRPERQDPDLHPLVKADCGKGSKKGKP